MSMGRRIAKRSIVGTRVSAPDKLSGIFCTGVIQAMTTTESGPGRSITKYSVRFDSGSLPPQEYFKHQMVGPGFQNVTEVGVLKPGQVVYWTHQGREVVGTVVRQVSADEVVIRSHWNSPSSHIETKKSLEEIRLIESRKSARLADSDTVNYAKLADSCDRKRSSTSWIDVPNSSNRKRRPVNDSCDSEMETENSSSAQVMDECTAAMVLMKLSGSPRSPKFAYSKSWTDGTSSPSEGSDASSWKSAVRFNDFGNTPTPSPPLRTLSRDDCIQSDASDESEDERLDNGIISIGRKKRRVFRCTWRGCTALTPSRKMIEKHIRLVHLGPKPLGAMDLSDHEEDFYYTEDEADDNAAVDIWSSSVPRQFHSYQEESRYLKNFSKNFDPTMSHSDMVRPPHEDPDYKSTTAGAYFPHLNERPSVIRQGSGRTRSVSWSESGDTATMKSVKSGRTSKPSTRRVRDGKKCRKVYGLEHREMWCTQCKWKKACTRFNVQNLQKDVVTVTVYADDALADIQVLSA
ncbi:zinc finger protein 704-like [Artemia franciscana]|uniref:C2H2-type domain-containing protein n=1 Tax=Artemia franciscana TaxID=6661 RepID=A0AA88ICX0_ARTSF|nr:hypothetical protein QYM36_004001 [Artemia franciscana]